MIRMNEIQSLFYAQVIEAKYMRSYSQKQKDPRSAQSNKCEVHLLAAFLFNILHISRIILCIVIYASRNCCFSNSTT